LNVIREVLGSDLTPEAVVAAARNQDELKPRLRERYEEFIRESPVVAPPRRTGELRPLIESVFPVVSAAEQSEHVINTLCFPLLYGHSAAAPDVLAAQLDGTDDYDLGAVLHVYAATAPLIDRDLLNLVDPTPRS